MHLRYEFLKSFQVEDMNLVAMSSLEVPGFHSGKHVCLWVPGKVPEDSGNTGSCTLKKITGFWVPVTVLMVQTSTLSLRSLKSFLEWKCTCSMRHGFLRSFRVPEGETCPFWVPEDIGNASVISSCILIKCLTLVETNQDVVGSLRVPEGNRSVLSSWKGSWGW